MSIIGPHKRPTTFADILLGQPFRRHKDGRNYVRGENPGNAYRLSEGRWLPIDPYEPVTLLQLTDAEPDDGTCLYRDLSKGDFFVLVGAHYKEPQVRTASGHPNIVTGVHADPDTIDMGTPVRRLTHVEAAAWLLRDEPASVVVHEAGESHVQRRSSRWWLVSESDDTSIFASREWLEHIVRQGAAALAGLEAAK